MDELNTIRTIITIGGVFASIAGAWWLMRYQISELRNADEKQSNKMATLFQRLDDIREQVALLNQKQSVIGNMMQPEALAEHHRWTEGVTKDIKYLRRDLDRVDASTACKECK